jgi:hypothetical protein
MLELVMKQIQVLQLKLIQDDLVLLMLDELGELVHWIVVLQTNTMNEVHVNQIQEILKVVEYYLLML